MKNKFHTIVNQQSCEARRPYNVYNIFFILERAKLIQDAAPDTNDNTVTKKQFPPCDFSGYVHLCLPELPPRYHGLQLPPNWYVPGKNAKRKHVATNGLRNFVELAQTVAQNWRAVDEVTLRYCQSVARILKERHAAITQAKGGLNTKKRTPKATTTPSAVVVTPIPVHSATTTTKDEEKVPCRHTSSTSAPSYNEMIATSFTSVRAIFNDDNVANPPPESASECGVVPTQTRYCYWSDRLPSTLTIVSRTSLNENDESSNQSGLYQDENNIMQFDALPDRFLAPNSMHGTADLWIEDGDYFDELLTLNNENHFF